MKSMDDDSDTVDRSCRRTATRTRKGREKEMKMKMKLYLSNKLPFLC